MEIWGRETLQDVLLKISFKWLPSLEFSQSFSLGFGLRISVLKGDPQPLGEGQTRPLCLFTFTWPQEPCAGPPKIQVVAPPSPRDRFRAWNGARESAL